ncbi:serine dehydratase subunit alpha family protein [Candidatus Proelusimicrobium excrementi]|uniref:L-cysteine desulfidase family protein n=1 Tax=Candidatus Proelusimicrobium excrementi TaxID=3416222 RepID=UPI003CBE7DF6|nr:serine dehydratase subunit alpha family protein [Elusimicrobiaceae bacterium]
MTTLLKQVLKGQVYPAMGCTEPVSVALCAANASALHKGRIKKAVVFVDSATFKNGLGVRIPNTDGEKGNLLAAALGLLTAKPKLGMEILKGVSSSVLKKAKIMLEEKAVTIKVKNQKGFYIKTEVLFEDGYKTKAVISGCHTAVTYLEDNGRVLIDVKAEVKTGKSEGDFKRLLAKSSLADLVREAQNADDEDLAYIKEGALMNLAAAKKGANLKKVGFYLSELVKLGMLDKNLINSAKILASQAADARMDGIAVPVMSSGESGNQGIVAVLVPYHVGKRLKIKEKIILQSIALSHLLNGYVKAFTGDLAPICGCAIAAGVGASAAIVYQQKGADLKAITLAVNNIISDIGGMLCDGAKSGCALKVVSSVDSALRAAFMGMNHYGITEVEGFIGKTAEATIQNLSRISTVGMVKVDTTIVDIMKSKTK